MTLACPTKDMCHDKNGGIDSWKVKTDGWKLVPTSLKFNP